MVRGDEPAGCCPVRDEATPSALRPFHTWPEASTQSQNVEVWSGAAERHLKLQ